MDYSSGLNYLTNLLVFQEPSTGYDLQIISVSSLKQFQVMYLQSGLF